MGYYTGGDYYMAGGLLDDLKGGWNKLRAAAQTTFGATPGGRMSAGMGLLTPGGLASAATLGASTGTAIGQYIAGGTGKKRRRMNVLNPRALRRAIARARGFSKFARKTVSITQRMKMKKRRR